MTGHDAAATARPPTERNEADAPQLANPDFTETGDAAVTSPFPLFSLIAEPSVLSTVAHGLRGPLTALVTSAELLVEDFDSLPPEQMRDMVTTMHRGALWLHGLVENLLCAATIRDGRFQIHRQTVALEDVIEEV